MRRALLLCGSPRAASRSRALLQALAGSAPPDWACDWAQPLDLPLFSPDREGPPAPPAVEAFLSQIARADLLLVAAPEYARTIPAVLKNALEWAVSRPEIIGKPVALAHASHRGDEMLGHLTRVLQTVGQLLPMPPLRLSLASLPPEAVPAELARAAPRLSAFWQELGETLDHPLAEFSPFPLDAAAPLP